MTPTLAIVPIERINLSTTQDDVPEEVRRRLNPEQAHHLRMAEAIERVVAEVPIPQPLEGLQQLLTRLMDTAIHARVVADTLAQPLRMRRAVHPGEALGHAENAAQHAYQAFKAELASSWPVRQWADTFVAIAQAAAQEGAWSMLEVVGAALEHDAGSVEWWEAVVWVQGLWGERNYSPSDLVAG